MHRELQKTFEREIQRGKQRNKREKATLGFTFANVRETEGLKDRDRARLTEGVVEK